MRDAVTRDARTGYTRDADREAAFNTRRDNGNR